uniref:LysM domain-containing protein n=1 Tax=Steinernema glaseri TaxID=37863 RepID=A0A1I8A2G5_9BILA
MDDYHDERSFLCGYRRCRGYGSTNDLNSPSTSALKYSELVRHEVSAQDTLRGIVVRYSSNMYELKRINRLWSDESLHCKTHIFVPLYGSSENGSTVGTPPPTMKSCQKRSETSGMKKRESINDLESMKEIFRRIDSNMKVTKKQVRRMEKSFDDSVCD